MAPKRLRQELPPQFFETGDEAETDPRVRRALKVSLDKLPRGAHARVRKRAELQAKDRAADIAARAHSGEGAIPAKEHRTIRRTAAKLAGQRATAAAAPAPNDGIDEKTAGLYVQHLTGLMQGRGAAAGRQYEQKQRAAHEFFALLGSINLPENVDSALGDYLKTLDAEGLLGLTALYARTQSATYCPAGHFARQLFRRANPAALMPADTAFELLLLLTHETLGYQAHQDLFWAVPDLANIVLQNLQAYEAVNPGQDAPASWLRPSGIGRVFLGMFAPAEAMRLQPSLKKKGLPAKSFPALDRPDLAPLATAALHALHVTVENMPSRRARRRTTRVRPAEVQAARRAQAATNPTLQAKPKAKKRPSRSGLRQRPVAKSDFKAG